MPTTTIVRVRSRVRDETRERGKIRAVLELPAAVAPIAARVLLGAALLAGLGACATAPAPQPEPEPVLAPQAPPSFQPITFASGSRELSTTARSSLRRVATILRSERWSALPINIEGHSDLRGGAGANLRISEARADAVARELEFNGVERERMQVRAFGEARPVVPEVKLDGSYDPEAAAANRRVEILVAEKP